MATEDPPKRGPGRPRKEDEDRQQPIGRLPDRPGMRDDQHMLVPAPDDPNQDQPMPATATAVVPGPAPGKPGSPDDKKQQAEFDKVQAQRERAARVFAVKDAPIAQAALDSEGDEKEQKKIPVTLKRGYFPLDGGEKIEAGSVYEMTKAELRAAKEAGIADVDMDSL